MGHNICLPEPQMCVEPEPWTPALRKPAAAPPPVQSAPAPAAATADPAVLQCRAQLFSGQYDDGPNMCMAPPKNQAVQFSPISQAAPASQIQQVQQKAPATGLSSYQVVPDDFIGPLTPNQIRQAQYNDLKTYNFDKFQVVPDDFVGPLQPTQMRQSQYQQTQQAWLNIADGRGMAMNGTKVDQERFRQMLREGMTDSPMFRETLTNIGNDTDPAHRITANVGRSQPGVILDSYGNDAIDLDDLEALPAAAPMAHKNQFTRNEDLLHILTERQYALTHPDPGGDKWKVFNDAHQHGIDTQNRYRDERGQSHVLSQSGTKRADGGTNATIAFADGSNERWDIDRNGKFNGVTPP